MTSRPLSATPHLSSSKVRVLFISLIISSAALLLFALLLFLFYLWHSLLLDRRPRTTPFDAATPLRLRRFSYRDLKSATSGFSPANALGRGGSGAVFRGILRDGKSVAVKRLDSASPPATSPSPPAAAADREFQNELQVLSGLRSPFVVTLLGYCVERRKKLLVYEYMPNRSLQEALFGEKGANLDWDRRFGIIIDIARALEFLHLECDPPVIHGDIKPSNVLLSSDYRAKVSDFGLSRVKMEGEFGVELFSQELGRSQELWKSQDLSGNLALASAELSTDRTPATTENCEVDFALALQASSSSKNSRKDFTVRTPNSIASINGNARNEGGDFKGGSYKGKEVSSMFATPDFGGEDWSKFVPLDDELCSADHSKELSASASPPLVDDPVANSKQWGKDWWWKQDGSGELCSKDYVMEWIGSQICPSRNPDWDDENKSSPKKSDLDVSTGVEKLEGMGETQCRDVGCSGQEKSNANKKEGRSGRGNSSFSRKQRNMKEWWKEEYFAEISRKGNKLRRLEGKWKKSFKKVHFDLGKKLRIRTVGSHREEKEVDNNQNMDISFRKGWKKKKTRSVSSDMWSGDLFSRELSRRRPLHVLASPMKLEKANLISWCRHLAHRGNVLELVDERLKGAFNKDQATLCINLALMCLQRMPELRPDIGEIVKVLRGEQDLPFLPFEFSPSPRSKLFSRSRRRHVVE
ncbi:hypothetical protein MRB53_009052 [Persea americana]|uniref:Uncharacterized protein n=1 Tax=Persea americana TaxID=3435 RepID=A0ACC2LMV3_PERAE|nr:hypothetical protein MRB53_009052 [Persea americana]